MTTFSLKQKKKYNKQAQVNKPFKNQAHFTILDQGLANYCCCKGQKINV